MNPAAAVLVGLLVVALAIVLGVAVTKWFLLLLILLVLFAFIL